MRRILRTKSTIWWCGMKRKIKRVISRLRPIKGQFAYELQVGPWVIQWRHDGKCWSVPVKGGFTAGPLTVWPDIYWFK